MPNIEVEVPGTPHSVSRLALGASVVRAIEPTLFNGCCPGVCFFDELGPSNIAPCGGYYLPFDVDAAPSAGQGCFGGCFPFMDE